VAIGGAIRFQLQEFQMQNLKALPPQNKAESHRYILRANRELAGWTPRLDVVSANDGRLLRVGTPLVTPTVHRQLQLDDRAREQNAWYRQQQQLRKQRKSAAQSATAAAASSAAAAASPTPMPPNTTTTTTTTTTAAATADTQQE